MGKFNQFMKKRGLLLAAGLCVAAAGVAGVGAINGMIDSLGQSEPSPTAEPQNAQQSETAWQTEEIAETPVGKTESGVPKASSSQTDTASKPGSSAAESAAPATDGNAAPAPAPVLPEPAQPENTSPRFVQPVAGEVMAHFSGDELLYNETMGDWRTHNGTDFAAAYGEKVCSVTSGTVKDVYEDVLWGWTVEIEGSDGLLRYAGLAHKPAVKQGEAVTAGDTIGKVDELDAEIAQDPHLHVEYEKDGVLYDVMELLNG